MKKYEIAEIIIFESQAIKVGHQLLRRIYMVMHIIAYFTIICYQFSQFRWCQSLSL